MNEKNLDKNLEKTINAVDTISEFLKDYKNSTQPLEETLKFNCNPSTKLILMCMLVYNKESYTTKELNSYLNRTYTYENYEKALSDFLNRKSIVIVNKSVSGRLRKAFSINWDKYYDESDE